MLACIQCGGATTVYDSRPYNDGRRVWRRRRCLSCQGVFTTWEMPVVETFNAQKQRRLPQREAGDLRKERAGSPRKARGSDRVGVHQNTPAEAGREE